MTTNNEALRSPRPEPHNVWVMTAGAVRNEAFTNNWLEVARIDGVDSTAHVWVDEMLYRVAILNPGQPSDYPITVVSFDTLGPVYDWTNAFRWALEFATELVIAETKIALG